MIRLILQRHSQTLLLALAVVLFVALGLGVLFGVPRSGDAQALGDPNAARPVAAAEPSVVGQPPVARPAALPAAALAAPGGGGEPANLIEARLPDARLHPAAAAAVQCAIGREVAHDPALDEVAIAIWRARASAEAIDDALAEESRIALAHNLRMSAVLSGFAADHAAGDDPCRFADRDLRTMLTASGWSDARAIGVAFFAQPNAAAPVSTLVVVAR